MVLPVELNSRKKYNTNIEKTQKLLRWLVLCVMSVYLLDELFGEVERDWGPLQIAAVNRRQVCVSNASFPL